MEGLRPLPVFCPLRVAASVPAQDHSTSHFSHFSAGVGERQTSLASVFHRIGTEITPILEMPENGCVGVSGAVVVAVGRD